ncbi:MAG: TonB family protein [Polyangiaceae bacterium]
MTRTRSPQGPRAPQTSQGGDAAGLRRAEPVVPSWSSARGIEIPIFVWALAAVGAHALWTGGAAGVTLVEEARASERARIREMVTDVRRGMNVTEVWVEGGSDDIEGDDPAKVAGTTPPTIDSPEATLTAEKSEDEAPPANRDIPQIETPKPEPEVAAAEPEKQKPETEEPPKEDPKKPTELVIVKDKRIAIRQIVKPDQKDNPNAPRLADQANTVEEETQARLRSTDSVSENPSLGEKHDGPADDEGNSSRTKIAQSEVSDGEKKQAPGEAREDRTDSRHDHPEPPAPASTNTPGGANGSVGGPTQGSKEQAPQPAVVANPGASGTPSPDVVAGTDGYSQTVSEAGGDGYGSIVGPTATGSAGVAFVPFSPKNLGLGKDSGAGGPLNLPWNGFVQAVGDPALDSQRAAIGASIRSEKRGKFDYDKFERWKPDIENYDPSVKLGNQTALNAAQMAGAGYLSTIHNAIHPIFAEEFLALLDGLPKDHILNSDLVTHVEIILDKDGNVARMGITKQSGSTMFDASALEAIDRAQPFGKAPPELASTDGLIYLHWEFHRDPVDACSTRNAQPFILKDPKPITRRPIKKKKVPAPTPQPTEGGAPTATQAPSQNAPPTTGQPAAVQPSTPPSGSTRKPAPTKPPKAKTAKPTK